MFNLLRMDLYRVKRSKSVYVCFGILMLMTIATVWLLWLTATPQGNRTAVSIGLLAQEEVQKQQQESALELEGINTQIMYRQMGLDGGAYACIFGIWLMLFVCMDYQSGFIKNIMASYQKRWKYAGSKIMTAAIVNLIYMTLHLTVILICNQVSGMCVPNARIGDMLFYFGWAWVVTTAFAALIVLICVFSRSVAAGAIAAMLLGTGTLVMPLCFLLDMFHIGGWMKYTIYRMLSEGPGCYASVKDLYVYAAGAVLLVLYTTAAGIVLKRQDI